MAVATGQLPVEPQWWVVCSRLTQCSGQGQTVQPHPLWPQLAPEQVYRLTRWVSAGLGPWATGAAAALALPAARLSPLSPWGEGKARASLASLIPLL